MTRVEVTCTYCWSRFHTVNCGPTVNNYQFSHLRSGQDSNSDLGGGRLMCYHWSPVAPSMGEEKMDQGEKPYREEPTGRKPLKFLLFRKPSLPEKIMSYKMYYYIPPSQSIQIGLNIVILQIIHQKLFTGAFVIHSLTSKHREITLQLMNPEDTINFSM